MNYKYTISFLATKQQKNWAAPKSEWIIAKHVGDRTWSEEFRELKSVTNGAHFQMKRFAHTDDALFNVRNQWKEISPDTSWTNYAMYYNNDLDMIILSKLEADGVQDIEGLLQCISSIPADDIDALSGKKVIDIIAQN